MLPEEMEDRRILRGTIGCPASKREYAIVDGVADFRGGEVAAPRAAPDVAIDAASVHALLGITNPGGYVVAVGSAARLAGALSERLEGVHVVGVNAPPEVLPGPRVSLLRSVDAIPLRTMARGIVLGGEYADEPWTAEAVRVLLRGMRIVVCADVEVSGCRPLADDAGVWVGQKT